MTTKKEIKQSEAKILIYLSVVHHTRKHVTAIAGKLNMDYSYVMRILQGMIEKGWLTKRQHRRFMFYENTPLAPMDLAHKAYFSEELQRSLDSYRQEDLTPKIAKESVTEGFVEVQDEREDI